MEPLVITVEIAGFVPDGRPFEITASYDANAAVETIPGFRNSELLDEVIVFDGLVYDLDLSGSIAPNRIVVADDLGDGAAIEDQISLEIRMWASDTRTISAVIGLETRNTDTLDDASFPTEIRQTDFEDTAIVFLEPFVFEGLNQRSLGQVSTEDFTLATTGGPPSFPCPPLDITEDEAQRVARLYEGALDRDGAIDLPGLNFWLRQLGEGAGLRDLALAFVGSPEFQALFGDPEALSSRAFVEILYENILDRPGDEAGIEFWTAQLESADSDAADVLLAFTESFENAEQLAFLDTLVQDADGCWSFATG